MNFNVYVDEEMGKRLERLAKARRTSRNALIREAVAQLLDRAADIGWPKVVADFEGDPRAHRFERSRRQLRAPKRDPLA
jgi:hypothetical protein